jgi:hypothetical protein
MWQTSGVTPLFISSRNGHVECVLALLFWGAATNQARVGCVVLQITGSILIMGCSRLVKAVVRPGMRA